MIKIYKVEFMQYTNALRATVHNKELDKYLEVGNNFLIRETELDKYAKYGEGFRKLEYVGMLIPFSYSN